MVSTVMSEIVVTTPSAGWETDGKLLYGYHLDYNDNGDVGLIQPQLSMETLHDDQVLYLCKNPNEWFPTHLGWRPNMIMLKVGFEFPGTEVLFTVWDEYMKLNPEQRKTIAKQKLRPIHQRYSLFSLIKNDRDELTESFLVNPTHYVKSITRVEYAY